MKLKQVEPKGNEEEKSLFKKVNRHYEMASQDLDNRLPDWNTKDELFRSHIDESNWPYNSVVFDPRVFTAIFEKTSRLLANKPRGRMVPREGGDTLGARINNELLSFEWDENERVDNQPMISKWATMDQNARKYGASFAICKWRYETRIKKDEKGNKKREVVYDGPDFKPCVSRDVLANPSYSTVKGWFQYREYVTLQELETVNDAAKTKPVYKNLDLLRQSIKKSGEGGGDNRATNWESKNKSLKSLTDMLGQDEYNKTIEVVTEYTNDKWTTFAPKHGVILREIENPYEHGQIPVVMLRYYQVDDDLYGLSEIEPIETLQKATNALVNQYLDAINMSLYIPLKIRATGVQMHTIEFGPGAKWIMNDPTTDIIPMTMGGQGVQEFASTYRFMIGAMQEALGEASIQASSMDPGAGNKTATEIKDMSMTRNARDNFNQIFLSEALKKQMMFWHTMNRQFLFNAGEEQKVIRIVGKDAIRYFQQRGLDGSTLTEDSIKALNGDDYGPDVQEEMTNLLAEGKIRPQDYTMPTYPVEVDGALMPKMTMEPGDEMGHLIIEKEDLAGNYDYIPDIESMSIPNDDQILATMKQMIELSKDPATSQMLAQEGYQVKMKELMEDFFEKLGNKDADKYFGKLEANGINAPGGIGSQAMQGLNGAPGNPGMGGVPQAMAGGQAQGVVPPPNRV